MASAHDPAGAVLDVLRIAPQDLVQPPAAQGMQVAEGGQRLRLDAVTKAEPGKITEGLFGGRQSPLRRLGVQTPGRADEPQLAGWADAIRLAVARQVHCKTGPHCGV